MSDASQPARGEGPAIDHAGMLALLGFFWAVAVGTHQGQGEIVRPTASVLLTLAGTALLVRPSSVALLCCVVLGQFLDIALHGASVAGHWLLLAAAGLWLLLGTGRLALQARRLPSPGEVYALHAPGLRVLLLVGCSLLALASLRAALSDPHATGAAHAAVAAEAGVLVLLGMRRTRVLGLLAGSAYHIAVGVSGAYDASAVILALYVPFLGDDFAARMRGVLARVPSAARAFALWLRVTHAPATLPALLLLALALSLLPGLLGWDARATERAASQVYRILWLDPAGLLPTMLLAAFWHDRPGLTHCARIGLGHPLALVPIALYAWLVLAQGSAP